MRLFLHIKTNGELKNLDIVSLEILADDKKDSCFSAIFTDAKSFDSNTVYSKIANQEYKHIKNLYVGRVEEIRICLINWLKRFLFVEFVIDEKPYYTMTALETIFGGYDNFPNHVTHGYYDISTMISDKYNIPIIDACVKDRHDILYQNYQEPAIINEDFYFKVIQMRKLYHILKGGEPE